MLKIKNVKNIEGRIVDHTIKSGKNETIDATGLTILPALIDPHVHFRVPGGEYKEDWQTGAMAAIAGGVTTILEMPNTNPATTNFEKLKEKKILIDKQLEDAGIPLRYQLYLGANKKEIKEIERSKKEYLAIKVFMGASTGNLLMDDNNAFEEVCKRAAALSVVVAVHAEDQSTLDHFTTSSLHHKSDPANHSKIRPREAAVIALARAIEVSKKYGNRLYVLHASTKEEVELVRQAKKEEVDIFLETTPHHLFLDESAYETWGTRVQMNPPLRTTADRTALWQGIQDGTIDTIGTDHAPHTLAEKMKPYGEAPSGVPGIETYLPLLLNRYNQGNISLEQITKITHTNVENVFFLEPNDDVVLVDLNLEKEIVDKNLKTKCGWSPFTGMKLKGWPIYTILKGQVYKI
jgi:dihydroorotase